MWGLQGPGPDHGLGPDGSEHPDLLQRNAAPQEHPEPNQTPPDPDPGLGGSVQGPGWEDLFRFRSGPVRTPAKGQAGSSFGFIWFMFSVLYVYVRFIFADFIFLSFISFFLNKKSRENGEKNEPKSAVEQMNFNPLYIFRCLMMGC